MAALTALLASAAGASAAPPEFNGSLPNTFTFSGGSATMEDNVGEAGICNNITGSGTITGHKTGTATLALTNCGRLPGLCHAEGNSSEWRSTELEVTPVYGEASHERVYLLLKPKAGSPFAKLTCGLGLASEARGSLLVRVTPVNIVTKTFTLSMSGVGGHEEPGKYLTEAGTSENSVLELIRPGFATLTLSITGSATMTTSKEMEIRK